MNNKQIRYFVAGFVTSALVGAGTALLLAPLSGKETRARLRERGRELTGKAEETYAQARERVTASAERLWLEASEMSDKMENTLADAVDEMATLTGEAAPDEKE